MKSGKINTRNTEKDSIVNLNVHFLFPYFPDHTFHNPRLPNLCGADYVFKQYHYLL